jgi:hypothetical protein
MRLNYRSINQEIIFLKLSLGQSDVCKGNENNDALYKNIFPATTNAFRALLDKIRHRKRKNLKESNLTKRTSLDIWEVKKKPK